MAEKKILISTLFLLLALSTSPILFTHGISEFDVTVQGQNLQRIYYSDSSAPDTSNLLWRFQMAAPPGEFACVVVDGVVYQGCLGTGDVYAVNELTGTQIWHVNLNNTANSLTYYDGKIITQGGSLPYDPVSRAFGDEWIALDAATGAIVWIYKVPQNEWWLPDSGTFGQSPVIMNGKMYINLANGIATLDPATGVELDRWGIVATSFYCAYSNGNLYGVMVNQTDGKHYAFSGNPATKTLNWVSKDNPVSPFGRSDIGGGMFSGVAFSDDFFVGEYNFSAGNANPNKLFRIRANDGAIAWIFPIDGYCTNSIAVAYNNVYAATSTGKIYAVSKTEGTSAVWTYETGPVYAPIVVADQKIFFGSEDTYVYALDAATGDLVWRYRTGGAIIGGAVIANGKLFVASKDQYLYAFGPALPKPASSVSLSAPQNVATGAALTVSGRLTDASGAPVVLSKLTFQQRLVPRVDWTNVTELTTDANGDFSFNWTPPIDGSYDLSVVYNGDGLAPSSATTTIKVGSSESVLDAINRLQTTLIIILAIILVLAVIAVVLSASALRQARKKAGTT